jgi:hypothetical protein
MGLSRIYYIGGRGGIGWWSSMGGNEVRNLPTIE